MALVLGVAIAAPIAAAPESPRFAHLSVDDGLSQSSVQNILQDRQGLLWFGTQEGLNRYDGYRFTVHRAREQEGFLRDHDITAMVEDPDGDLWVGTSRGLYRYDLDTGRFDSCAPPVDQLGIVNLVASGDGRIFFAASDGQLWTLDRGDAERRARPLNDGAVRAAARRERAGRPPTAVRPSGRPRKASCSKSTRRAELPAGSPRRSAISAPCRSWRAIGRATCGSDAPTPSSCAIGQPTARSIAFHRRRGERWRSCRREPARSGSARVGGGLSRLDPATGELAVYRHDPDEPSSLSSDDVAAIYEDAVGSLWIGSWNGGVDRFDPDAQAFRTLRPRPRTPDSLPAADVTAMHEAPDGALWLASRGGLLMTGDPRSGRFRTVATLPPKGGVFALGWWNGRILVGMGGGLVVFDALTGREVALDGALQAHRLGERPHRRDSHSARQRMDRRGQ